MAGKPSTAKPYFRGGAHAPSRGVFRALAENWHRKMSDPLSLDDAKPRGHFIQQGEFWALSTCPNKSVASLNLWENLLSAD